MIDKKVIKNTAFLYLRMLMLIAINLFNTKYLLEYLGVVDFGIYSLIWGAVLLLGFVNNSITGSVQRFLNITIESNDVKKLVNIYSVSVVIFFVLGVLLSTVLIVFKDIVFFNYLNIPTHSLAVANKVYYFMVGSFFVNFISLNFHSCLISTERFSFYAFITVFESLLKLCSVFLLISLTEKLYFYSLFLLLSSVVVLFVLYWYVKYRINFCKFEFVNNIDDYKAILSFVSWSFFGSFGVIVSGQGIPLIANVFYGVIINGSLSIASQLNSLIGTVTNNFQKAFSPYLMKKFVGNDGIDANIFSLTKISVVFYSIAALPLFFYTYDFLTFWLDSVPIYVEGIVKISAVISLFEVLAGPLWMLIQAEGNIKKYQISVFLVMIFSLPLTYILLYLNFGIYYVWYMLFILNIILFFVRLYFVNKIIGEEFYIKYIKNVLIPVGLFLSVCGFIFYTLSLMNKNQDLIILMALNFFGILSVLITACFLLLNEYQRQDIFQLIIKFKNKI